MAKSKNQKGKILYVERLLYDTGESKMVTMQEILDFLKDRGILAERKSIYDDLSLLRELGMDVRYRHGKPGGYYKSGILPGSLLDELARLISGEKKARPQRSAGTGAASDADLSEASGPDQGFGLGFRPEADPGPEREAASRNGNGPVREVRLSFESEKGYRLVQEYLGGLPEVGQRDDGVCFVTARICESPEFYGWLTAAGREVRLENPSTMIQNYLDYLDTLSREYEATL